MRRMDVLARIPITYTAIDGSVVHSPMIAGRLGGIETLFVLDTGSEVHLLTRELADRVGLEGAPGEAGTDHAGATLASWDIGSVELRVGRQDDTALTLGDVVAIPAPRPFPGWGVGGILSPQHLHPTASIVIDLWADELVLVEGSDDDLRSWLATRGSDLDLLALPRDAAFPSLVVPAALDPHPDIPVMLNTGGKHTEFLAEAAPGVAHGPLERTGGGVSGADVRASAGGPALLRVGGRRLPVGELYVRSSMIEPHGLIGMDVLRGTILVGAADPGRAVLWLVPPDADVESSADRSSSM